MTVKLRGRPRKPKPRRPPDPIRGEAALIRRKLARHRLDGPIPTDHDPCRRDDDET